MLEPERNQCHVWKFPAGDFDAWREFVGPHEWISTYDEYLLLLGQAIDAAMARDYEVIVHDWPVAHMRAKLTAENLPNTSANRAAMLASGITLGIKITAKAIGWAIIKTQPHGDDRWERKHYGDIAKAVTEIIDKAEARDAH